MLVGQRLGSVEKERNEITGIELIYSDLQTLPQNTSIGHPIITVIPNPSPAGVTPAADGSRRQPHYRITAGGSIR